jgi:hypothetical protein
MSDLKKILSHPIPIPVSQQNGKMGGVAIDVVYVQPKVLIKTAAELLNMLAGDEPEEVVTEQKIITKR